MTFPSTNQIKIIFIICPKSNKKYSLSQNMNNSSNNSINTRYVRRSLLHIWYMLGYCDFGVTMVRVFSLSFAPKMDTLHLNDYKVGSLIFPDWLLWRRTHEVKTQAESDSFFLLFCDGNCHCLIVTHNGGNEWCKRDLNLIHTHSYKETFKLYMLFIHHLCLCLLPSRWVHLDTLNLPWQEFFSNLIQKLGSTTSFILIFF